MVPDLTGKTFVITGTTSGTEKVAAHTIASKGGRVMILNRPSPRSEKPNKTSQRYIPMRIYKLSNVTSNHSHLYSPPIQVRNICTEGIYALINNAGIMAMPDEATVDGFDTQMQTQSPLSSY